MFFACVISFYLGMIFMAMILTTKVKCKKK